LLFPYAPLRFGGKLILKTKEVSQTGAKKEHKKIDLDMPTKKTKF
jgi:hypothetical protein